MTKVLVLDPHAEIYRDRLQAEFPTLQFVLAHNAAELPVDLTDIDVLISFAIELKDEFYRRAARLKWVQCLATGVDHLLRCPSLKPDVYLTSGRGIHGAPVSEAAIGSMLALARDIPRALRAQGAREWARFPAKLLHNKTVGVFGIGAIAEELAPKCKAFGMRTIGVSSAPRPVEGFDRMHSSAELAGVVGEFDFFVLLTPLTEKTRNAVDAKVLAAMKRTSFLVNLARGGVVDEPALVEALKAGRIAGAALDVFNEEPLPADHPFWAMENVIITTHQGGFCDVYIDYALPTVEANMRCFLNGDIGGMINVVPH